MGRLTRMRIPIEQRRLSAIGILQNPESREFLDKDRLYEKLKDIFTAEDPQNPFEGLDVKVEAEELTIWREAYGYLKSSEIYRVMKLGVLASIHNQSPTREVYNRAIATVKTTEDWEKKEAEKALDCLDRYYHPENYTESDDSWFNPEI